MRPRTFVVLIFLASLVPGHALAHKGSPWHCMASCALGANTIYLDLPPGQESARFRVRYPVQANKLEYAVGDTSTVIIVSDEALKKDGFVTETNAVLAHESDSYSPTAPMSEEFEIRESGYYHVLFGPGRNTSILVLEPSLTVAIDPVTAGAKAGAFLAPATSGDFHVVKDPAQSLKRFAGWFAVFFDEFQPIYDKHGVASARTMQLEGERAVQFAKAISERGYPGFAGFKRPVKPITGPFLGHVNGLSVEAVDAAFLQPGEYEFVYKPRGNPATIMQTNEVVLQVMKDRVYAKGYGVDSDVVARAEIPASNPEYRIRFKVTEPGHYHMTYGPGEGGFIFHLLPDDELPTQIVPRSGSFKDHTRLVGINSVIVGARPLNVGGTWQVFFPCKIVKAKAEPRRLFGSAQVPLSTQTAVAVSRLGAAVMHPIMIQNIQNKLDLQRKELMRLQESTEKK